MSKKNAVINQRPPQNRAGYKTLSQIVDSNPQLLLSTHLITCFKKVFSCLNNLRAFLAYREKQFL